VKRNIIHKRQTKKKKNSENSFYFYFFGIAFSFSALTGSHTSVSEAALVTIFVHLVLLRINGKDKGV